MEKQKSHLLSFLSAAKTKTQRFTHNSWCRPPIYRWNRRCGCDECVTSRQEDSLRHSRSRINAYRALASPSLIALSSKDPILTAFELSWELRRLSFLEHEFKVSFFYNLTSLLIRRLLTSDDPKKSYKNEKKAIKIQHFYLPSSHNAIKYWRTSIWSCENNAKILLQLYWTTRDHLTN